MFEKECRVCGIWFQAKTERRQLCDSCQKNSAKAQAEIDNAIHESKRRLGELPSQQYYACQCQYCGKEFHSYGRAKLFCSAECAQEHSIRTAVCPICEKQLYPLGIYVKSGSKCCSKECNEERRLRAARAKGKTANCRVCTKEFIQKNDWDEFCCKECEASHLLDTARRQGRTARCKACGKEFVREFRYKDTCSAACDAVYRKSVPAQLIEDKCEICGKTFTRHVNVRQYTCGRECAAVRLKTKAAAAREEKRTSAVAGEKQERTGEPPERERLVKGVLSGAITGDEARKLHLCTHCKTSQQDCEWFTSKFFSLPEGAVAHAVNRHHVVLACPKYNA